MKSIRYTYQTTLDSNICSETLQEAIDSQKNRIDFPASMLTGIIHSNHLYLHRANQLASSFEPILFADIIDTQDGSIISGYFKIHWSSKVFLYISLFFVTLVTMFLTFILAKLFGGSSWLGWCVLLVAIGICLFFWILIMRLSKITESKTQYVRRFIEYNLHKTIN